MSPDPFPIRAALVHGSGQSPRALARLEAALRRPTICPALERAAGEDPLATDVLTVEGCMGPDPIDLFGHSYGGRVALEVVRRGRVSVRRLALFEPVVPTLMAPLPPVPADPVDALRSLVDYWSGDGCWDALPDVARASYRRAAPQIGAELRCLAADALLPRDIDFDGPTLVLTRRFPHEAHDVAGALVAGLRSARHATIPQGGHMAPVTHPEAVARTLRSFFDAP